MDTSLRMPSVYIHDPILVLFEDILITAVMHNL